jgi:hypothetical protein
MKKKSKNNLKTLKLLSNRMNHNPMKIPKSLKVKSRIQVKMKMKNNKKLKLIKM